MSDNITSHRPSSLPPAAPYPVTPAAAVAPVARAETPRLWPVVIILTVQWALNIASTWFAPTTPFHMFGSFQGPMIGTILVLLWWLFASRVRWGDRLEVLALGAAVAPVVVLTDPKAVNLSTDPTGLFPGFMKLLLYALPVAFTLGTLWLLLTSSWRWPLRRFGLLLVLLLTLNVFALLRFEGTWGNILPQMSWRWRDTAETVSLAEINKRPVPAAIAAPAQALSLQPGDWPAFRGPERDSQLRGVRLATDWSQKPPKQLWRQRVGPGWSSFAVIGKRLYTQEQRGEEEVVACYDADSGKELWLHKDRVRFSELVGGDGPRATPTFHEGNLYTLGAKGRVNCLNAATGAVLWSRDLTEDTKAKVPMWAFSSSPLVLHGLVTVFAGGPEDKAVQAYDAATGAPKWAAGKGTHSYCSPQRTVLDGVEQILIATDAGLTGLHPTSGAVLWNYDWSLGIQRVVQPALVGKDEVLLGTPFAKGTRRLHVSKDGDSWNTKEVWATKAISPYFSDSVIHKDHLYGFDGDCLTCVNLQDGKRCWKERGYGTGQALLLPEQDMLLVLAETGEVALVAAKSDAMHELTRAPALTGKTWNHPVVAHGRLFVRNSEEMACFQLPEQSGAAGK
jgi:outer membrane protein assembly factor BamB